MSILFTKIYKFSDLVKFEIELEKIFVGQGFSLAFSLPLTKGEFKRDLL
jgi:hypothetical protein